MRTNPIPFQQKIKIVIDSYRKNYNSCISPTDNKEKKYKSFIIPEPEASESKNEFISRCVSTIIDEYPQEQALALCYDKWNNQ